MNRISKLKSSVAGAPVTFDKSDTGVDHADSHRQLQVSCTGLAGGTFVVQLLVADSVNKFVDLNTPATEENVVALVGDNLLYEQVKVVFDGLGVGAAPKVLATFWQKGL